MFSHGWPGGDDGKSEHGQASPIAAPSILVLDAGQMDDKPSMRTDHKVVMGTMGTDDASVDG